MERFKWTLHNLIGHPVSEIVYLLIGRRYGLARWVHDVTMPPEDRAMVD
jgi:hypothetical protein